MFQVLGSQIQAQGPRLKFFGSQTQTQVFCFKPISSLTYVIQDLTTWHNLNGQCSNAISPSLIGQCLNAIWLSLSGQCLNATCHGWPMFECHMAFDKSKSCLVNQTRFNQLSNDHSTKPPIKLLMNTPIAQALKKTKINLNQTTQSPIQWFLYPTKDQPLP